MCHNLFLNTFVVLLSPGIITFTFTISIILTVQATKKGLYYNREKICLESFVCRPTLANFSFGYTLVLDTIVLDNFFLKAKV